MISNVRIKDVIILTDRTSSSSQFEWTSHNTHNKIYPRLRYRSTTPSTTASCSFIKTISYSNELKTKDSKSTLPVIKDSTPFNGVRPNTSCRGFPKTRKVKSHVASLIYDGSNHIDFPDRRNLNVIHPINTNISKIAVIDLNHDKNMRKTKTARGAKDTKRRSSLKIQDKSMTVSRRDMKLDLSSFYFDDGENKMIEKDQTDNSLSQEIDEHLPKGDPLEVLTPEKAKILEISKKLALHYATSLGKH